MVKEWDHLDECLDGLTFPIRRKHDLGWLSRNLAISNPEHPKLDVALAQVRHLLRVINNTQEEDQ